MQKVSPKATNKVATTFLPILFFDKAEDNVGDKFNGVEDVGLGVA